MAGSKSDTFETSILSLIFTNSAIAGIGDTSGLQPSATAGNLYVALYTTAPTDSTSGTETTYVNYSRVAVPRTSGGWTVANGACYNTAAVTFPTCGSTGQTVNSFSIMTSLTGSTMLYWGDLTSTLAISNGITPEFAIGDIDITED